MSSNLIIVESPTKCRTLARFLGKEYKLTATMGHVRDLPKKKLGVDVEHDFEPEYVLVEGRKKTVTEIKKQAQGAQKIFLAMDPDREGEAIAYHVAVLLGERRSPTEILVSASDSLAKKRPLLKRTHRRSQNEASQNLVGSHAPFSRITFHEITQSAIEKALAHPGVINMQLVDAQQARRVLDRLVGYKLSPLLWRKIRRGLSAGRVQSVAVRLIVDREREIEKFVPEEYWEILAQLRRHLGGQRPDTPTFFARLDKKNGQKVKIVDGATAEKIVAELKSAGYEVFGVEKKEVKQNPSPPFTTSTLQQQAVQRLRFSGKRTMRAAQSLYEKGLITYHRTDSVALAQEAIRGIRGYINSTWGGKYLPPSPRIYKTKSKVAQEAHEAIRPTSLALISNLKSQTSNKDEERLYNLIWKRTVACQMSSAIFDQTKVQVQAAGQENIYLLLAEGKVMKFEGWRKLYEKNQNDKQAMHVHGEFVRRGEERLPELSKGDELDLLKVTSEQKFTQPPPRYNEATLIKTLEEKGIGRPSTYAPTISTIQTRQYVEKQEGRFHPTQLGTTVNDFLVEYFSGIIDYDFTAQMEDDLDKIANGKRQWVPVIREFYQPFEEKLLGVAKVAERVQVPTEATGEKCPQCQEGQLVIRLGKFGKFISCSRFPQCKYSANFVPKLEGAVCPECGGEVVIKKTKKGKQFYGCSRYPKCKWASWRKPEKK